MSELVKFILDKIIEWIADLIRNQAAETRTKKYISQMPSPLERERLIKRIREMQTQDSGYHERLDYLLKNGMSKQIAEEILAEAERAGFSP